MPEKVIPFPAPAAGCPEKCPNSTRIAVLESRMDASTLLLDRIETKVDGLKNWLMGAVLSVTVAMIAIVAALLRH